MDLKLRALDWEIACPFCNYTVKGAWSGKGLPYQVIISMIKDIGKPCPMCKIMSESARKWTR